MRETKDTLLMLFKSKISYYVMFSTLLVNFLLYHNNFFTPAGFWIFYSILSMFVIPVMFFIVVEETKAKIKITYTVLFLISVFIMAMIMLHKSFRNFFSPDFNKIAFIAIMLVAVIVYMFLKKDFILKKIGVSYVNWKLTSIITVLGSILMIIIVILGTRNPEFKEVYPLFKVMKKGGGTFLIYQLYFFIFFFCWEFLFRGFMLFAFYRCLKNPVLAILFQTIIFTFAHLGKPELETVSSFFGGILLGIIVLRVKNMMPAFLIHYITALTMDIIAVYF